MNKRKKYKSSGRVDLFKFTPLYLLTLTVCLALGWTLDFLYRNSFYFIVIIPALAAVIAALVYKTTVKISHCRSNMISCFCGLFAGLLLFLSCYYFGMVNDSGDEKIYDIKQLPDYIVFRMQNDTVESSSSYRSKPTDASQVMNWVGFGIELTLVAFIISAWGLYASRRAYCEKCKKWMKSKMFSYAPGEGREIKKHFTAGDISSICNLPEFSIVLQKPSCLLLIEFCSDCCTNENETAGYLSLKEAKQTGAIDPYQNSFGKKLIKQQAITAEELEQFIGERSKTSAQEGSDKISDHGSHVEITPLPAHEANKVLSRKNIFIGTFLALSPIFLLFFCLGLMGLGAYLLGTKKGLGNSEEFELLGMISAISGFAGLFFTVIYIAIHQRIIKRWRIKELEKAFKWRKEQLVKLNTPDSHLIEYIPRENWRIMLETAADVGLLKIDKENQCLLFEGDKERYKIHGQAIHNVTIEPIKLNTGQVNDKIQMVIIDVKTPEGLAEMPINPDICGSKKNRKLALEAASNLRSEILQIMPEPSFG